MTTYAEFLETKRVDVPSLGFAIDPSRVSPSAFDFQRDAIVWAVGRGRAALFVDTGLGKTIMQLEIARIICEETGGDALILAPLAVVGQTHREGQKFGITTTIAREDADVRPGINLANYEILHKLDPSRFVCVVLDESSILRNYSGKVRRQLTDAFVQTPYRFSCSATPAPNFHLEIGQQAEFLGVMSGHQMIARWFINTFAAGDYRLKAHAQRDFWDWVASWALSLRRPSELGYSDEGFDLPPLVIRQHVVPVNWADDRGERLFRDVELSATTMHTELRRTAPSRAAKVAELVGAEPEATWLVWCHTDYEADAVTALLPDAVEVRGSESPAVKERKLRDFAEGRIRILVTKPVIAGYGLNFQHCNRMAFIGLSYSMESYYQAVRRAWRFGQSREVVCHVVLAETEATLTETIARKLADHEQLMEGMRSSSARLTLSPDRTLTKYRPNERMFLPAWLKTLDEGAAA